MARRYFYVVYTYGGVVRSFVMQIDADHLEFPVTAAVRMVYEKTGQTAHVLNHFPISNLEFEAFEKFADDCARAAADRV